MSVDKRGGVRFSWTEGWLFLLVFGCWIAGSLGQIVKNFPHRALWFCVAGAIGVVITLAVLRWLQSRGTGQIKWSWLAAFWVVLVALYLILYPISQRHIVGVGSDSEDALRRTAIKLLHHRYLYSVRTYLGNAISPLPGAVFLATPFYLMGRVSFQNLAWLAAFVFFCGIFFRERSTALAFLLVFVLASASTLDNFIVGDDYVTNAWYVCILVYVFLKTFEQNAWGWKHIVSGFLLGLALSSRPTFVVIPPLLLAYLLQHSRRTAEAWRSLALPLLVAAAVTLPFYLYNPRHFSPLHIRGKLDFLPPIAGNVLMVGLPLVAVAVACLGFFVRLTMPRLFLIAGIAMGFITLSPALMQAGMTGFSRVGWGLLDYSIPAATFVGLWTFSRYEQGPSAFPKPSVAA